MPLARFMKVCLDAEDPVRLAGFWSAALARPCQADGRGEAGIMGDDTAPTLWFNHVSDPKSVKHRMHLDIYTTGVDALEALGAHRVEPAVPDLAWTVMADPDGGEFCAFGRASLPPNRLHGLGLDCADPIAQSQWWQGVLGGTVVDDPHGFATVRGVAGMPIATLDFAAVEEPKSGSNRVHFDLACRSVPPLVDHGATVLREPGGDIAWHVLADPEGNEFCAFTR